MLGGMFDLRDRFETADGSRPDATVLPQRVEQEIPLPAFTVLAGGDVFDAGGKPSGPGLARAADYVAQKVTITAHAGTDAHVERIRRDIVRLLAGHDRLSLRLMGQKPVDVEVVPDNAQLSTIGFPPRISSRAAGLFWDRPDWDRARIGLSARHLETEPALVFHEMGHAVHYLAFTARERELIYRVLRPTFGSRAAMDEVFAIYTERELLGQAFAKEQQRAPGVYGFTRRQWDENHLFTRFARKLYFPHKPLAGDKGKAAGDAWRKFSGG